MSYFSILKPPETDQEAEAWADPKVQRWFNSTCGKHFEMTIEQMSVLKSLDAHGVKALKREHWQEMSPEYGHIFFNMWQDDQQKFGDRAKEYYEGP